VVKPRLRWLEDAENDVRELKVKRWKQKSSNVVQVHRECQRPGVSV
jgi:hypothetical protein